MAGASGRSGRRVGDVWQPIPGIDVGACGRKEESGFQVVNFMLLLVRQIVHRSIVWIHFLIFDVVVGEKSEVHRIYHVRTFLSSN